MATLRNIIDTWNMIEKYHITVCTTTEHGKRVQLERQMEADNSEPVPEENSQEESDQDNGMRMG